MDRIANLRGTRYAVHDGPSGRIIDKPAVDAEIGRPAASEQRYDVVTIGGWSQVVAGVDEVFPDPVTHILGRIYPGVETVNGFFGEKNHIFAAGLTKEQVNAGSWTWGRGTTETHFAIAAILAGTRNRIPDWEGLWYNTMLPASIMVARSIGENASGGPITLTLTVGQIGN